MWTILRTLKSNLVNTDFEGTFKLYQIMLLKKVDEVLFFRNCINALSKILYFNVFPFTGFWTFVEM